MPNKICHIEIAGSFWMFACAQEGLIVVSVCYGLLVCVRNYCSFAFQQRARFPGSIGPPVTKMEGISSLAAAINSPSMMLSHEESRTRPSNRCTFAIIFIEAAKTSLIGSSYLRFSEPRGPTARRHRLRMCQIQMGFRPLATRQP